MKIPMSIDILMETDIVSAINKFRRICKTDEISSLRMELFRNWRKLLPDDTTEEKNQESDKSSVHGEEVPSSDMDYETAGHSRELIVYAKGIDTDITRGAYAQKIYSDIKQTIDREPSAVKVKQSLRIKCRNEEEKNKLFSLRYLAGHRVEISEPYENNGLNKNTKRGIIFNMEEDISKEEMEEAFGIPVERIIKRRGGQRIETKQVILHFKDELPGYVYFGYRRFRVSLYIPEPQRCYKCQRFGHIAKNCNSVEICPVCSRKHSYVECPVKENYREQKKAVCANCRGNHRASYKG